MGGKTMKLRHLRLWIVLGVIALVLRPADAAAGKNAARIAGGYQHSLGLKADGSLWAWGYNGYGQLGLGDYTNRRSPTKVGTGWVAIAGGYSHSLGLKADGSLWAWGNNGSGQLGLGDTTNRLSPTQIKVFNAPRVVVIPLF